MIENSISSKRLDQDNAVLPFLSSVPVLDKSRLLQEFEVIQYLGEGGFGSVVQVVYIVVIHRKTLILTM